MTHCVIYTRFSPRPDAEECDSCDKQEDRCIAYATRKDYSIASMFRDSNVSGGKLIRPGLQAAIEMLEPDWVLVVDRSDRLSRDIAVGLAIRKQVKAGEGRIEYADGTKAYYLNGQYQEIYCGAYGGETKIGGLKDKLC